MSRMFTSGDGGTVTCFAGKPTARVNPDELEVWTEAEYAKRALPEGLTLGAEFVLNCPVTVYAVDSSVPRQEEFLTVGGSHLTDHPFADQQTDTAHVITSRSHSPSGGDTTESGHNLHPDHDAVIAVNPQPIPSVVLVQVLGVIPEAPPGVPPIPVHGESVADYSNPADQAVPDRTSFEHTLFWRPQVKAEDGTYELLDESIFFDISTVSIGVYPVTIADPFLVDPSPAFIADIPVETLSEWLGTGRPAQRADTSTETGQTPLTVADNPTTPQQSASPDQSGS